ncbi:MAG: exopolysaccharide biosynthesis polyprenyl glycosylphosphotransferase [Terracidiphilus sp.]|jgi:exopolysaccharide biosynthesis polyprenyl glycosylphosphotransferase
MNSNAFSARVDATAYAAQSPAAAAQSGVFEDWKAPPLSMPLLRISADFLLLLIGTMVGGAVGHLLQRSHTFELTLQQLFIGSLVYSGLTIGVLIGDNAYPRVCSLLHIKETEIVLRGSIKAIVVCLVLCFVARYSVPRMATLAAWVSGTLYLTMGRVWVQDKVRKYLTPAMAGRRALIYGTKRTARRFFSGALHSPMLGIDPVGFVSAGNETSDVIYSNDYFRRDSCPVFHESLSVEMLERLAIQDIFVCDSISANELNYVREVAQTTNCSISLVDNQEVLASRIPTWVWEMDGLIVATTALNDPGQFYRVSKRVLDIVCSVVLIALSAPIWALLAALIRMESKGPIFFRQTRVGQHGKPFEIFKFRSMKVDAPKYARSPDEGSDPRITRIGRLLRKTSMDEVPQLINVLKGDMSLVGPRPEMPFITEEYGPLEATRLAVPQGITGFWQLSADRRYAIHQSIEYDLYYIQNRTVLLDIAVLLHTLLFAAKGI